MATRLALTQETPVRFPPPELGLDTPTGRAARLKPERVWVRIPLQAELRIVDFGLRIAKSDLNP